MMARAAAKASGRPERPAVLLSENSYGLTTLCPLINGVHDEQSSYDKITRRRIQRLEEDAKQHGLPHSQQRYCPSVYP